MEHGSSNTSRFNLGAENNLAYLLIHKTDIKKSNAFQ